MVITKELLSQSLIEEMLNYFIIAYKDYPDSKESILNPNWEAYNAFQEIGALYIYTVRDDKKLVGYAWYITMPSLHSKHDTYAAADTLYLDKDYRGKFLGIKLFKYAEADLKTHGINKIIYSLKTYDNWGSLLERLGYANTELTYQKRIT